MKTFTIKMVWDDGYWHSIINENAGFGLTLESDSYETLAKRVKIAIQDILEVDFKYTGEFTCVFQTEHVENMHAQAS